MAGFTFRLPGFERPVQAPESYISGVLRNFPEAAQALGVAVDRLVLRLAESGDGDPDYQIQTIDGEDAVAFSGSSHAFMHDDITRRIETDRLQDQTFTLEQAKDWLNAVNGEGSAAGGVDPILSDRWREGDTGDPRN